jgi:tetratricopeptide (TPR) repeat protein
MINGDLAYRNGHYEDAIQNWLKAAKIEIKNADLQRKLGFAYKKVAKYELAEKAFRSTLKLDPYDSGTFVEIDKIRIIYMDFEAARAICRQLIAANTGNVAVLALNGDLLMLEGAYESAEKTYRQALRLSSDTQTIQIKLAICLVAQGKKNAAQDVHNRLFPSENYDALVYVQIANYWKLLDEFEQADRFIQMALNLNPNDYSIQLSAAEFYISIGELNSAEIRLKKLLTEHPHNLSLKKSPGARMAASEQGR